MIVLKITVFVGLSSAITPEDLRVTANNVLREYKEMADGTIQGYKK